MSGPRRSSRSPGSRRREDLYVHLTRADLLVVAPLTANTLAKLAHGLADNLVAEAALAHRGPVLLAPAMNPRMWASPATQANVESSARVARCSSALTKGKPRKGEWGVGRMAEPKLSRHSDQVADLTSTITLLPPPPTVNPSFN